MTNAEIARPDVVTWVRTRDLKIVCEFNFSGLPLHLRPKKKTPFFIFRGIPFLGINLVNLKQTHPYS